MKIQSMAQVLSQPPKAFSPKESIAACYLECEGKLLLLRRSLTKKEGGLWGVPAGKIEAGETPLEAVQRELKEETGITVNQSELHDLGTLYIRKPEIDYTYTMFWLVLPKRPSVSLNDENDAIHWAAVHDLEIMPLRPGARSAYQQYSAALPGAKKRTVASVSSYLILIKDGKVLLGLRQNTGYCDGMWSFPAGHVEEGEPASLAMVREAEEEIGIRLDPACLKAVHIMHRQSNRLNVDIFFTCSKWEEEIENREPEKCEKLSFFPLDALPSNLVGYIRQALDHVAQGIFFSEPGWE
jgi:8-oxo-dGTP diphosphatase